MLPYILMLLLIFITILLENLTQRIYFKYIGLLIIFLFSALRFNVGWDYAAYYNTIDKGILTNIVANQEFITIMLVKLTSYLNMPILYFAINSFVCCYLIFSTTKKYSRDFWISMIFFICFPLFYLNSFSVIRMFSAISVTFYGLKFIYEKNLFKYLFVVVIASLFHKSAIICLSFYFIGNVKIKPVHQAYILLLLPFIKTLFNKSIVVFFPRYAVYTQPSLIQEGTKAIVVFIFIGFLSIFLWKRLLKKGYLENICFNLYFTGLCIYLMFYNQGTMGHRLSLYGTIYSVLLIPSIIDLFKIYDRLILKYSIIISCVLMFLFVLHIGAATYLPYQTIFQILK